MREGLKQDIKALLSNYLGNLEYWVECYELGCINSTTGGTPNFETWEDANAYRVMVKAVLKEFRDA